MEAEKTQPSTSLVSFACPHCGSYSQQSWSDGFARQITSTPPLPWIPDAEIVQALKVSAGARDSTATSQAILDRAQRLGEGELFLEGTTLNASVRISNLFVSTCHPCGRISLWVHNRLIYPSVRIGVEPNPDLPKDVLIDYEEARSLLAQSPRSAAALLRLAVQKLCMHLGEKGKDINHDIGQLVQKGLNAVVQQALDSVIVIGNEAVHPGQMDIADSPEVVERLFKVLNYIADQMISQPRAIKDIYGSLPEGKRAAIAARDFRVDKGE